MDPRDILKEAREALKLGEIAKAYDLMKSASALVNSYETKCPGCNASVQVLAKTEQEFLECDKCGSMWGIKKAAKDAPALVVKSNRNEDNNMAHVKGRQDVVDKLWDLWKTAEPGVEAFDINRYAATGYINKSYLDRLGIKVESGEPLAKSGSTEPMTFGGLSKAEVIHTMLTMFKANEEPQYINRHSITKFDHFLEISDEAMDAVLHKSGKDPSALSKGPKLEDQEVGTDPKATLKDIPSLVSNNPANGDDEKQLAAEKGVKKTDMGDGVGADMGSGLAMSRGKGVVKKAIGGKPVAPPSVPGNAAAEASQSSANTAHAIGAPTGKPKFDPKSIGIGTNGKKQIAIKKGVGDGVKAEKLPLAAAVARLEGGSKGDVLEKDKVKKAAGAIVAAPKTPVVKAPAAPKAPKTIGLAKADPDLTEPDDVVAAPVVAVSRPEDHAHNAVAALHNANDKVSEHDLKMFADNDQATYKHHEAIRGNLVNKLERGRYDHTLAPKLWEYGVESALRNYHKDSGSGGKWHGHMSPETRKAVASKWADDFKNEYDHGGFEHLKK